MSSADSASTRPGLTSIQRAVARTSAVPPARTCLDMFVSPFLLITPPCSRGSDTGRKTTALQLGRCSAPPRELLQKANRAGERAGKTHQSRGCRLGAEARPTKYRSALRVFGGESLQVAARPSVAAARSWRSGLARARLYLTSRFFPRDHVEVLLGDSSAV